MTSNGRKKARATRVALELAPDGLGRVWQQLRRADVLLRISLGLVAAILMWGVCGGWDPPFPYRVGYVPVRSITARVAFQVPDPRAFGMETRRFISYKPGDALIGAGQPLNAEAVELLQTEHREYVGELGWTPL